MTKSEHTSFFKTLLGALVLTFCITALLRGQQVPEKLNEGLTYYKKGNYTKALPLFKSIDSPEATLFTAKSLFGLGKFIKSRNYLQLLRADSISSTLRHEALYTRALVEFQLHNFSSSLVDLHQLRKNEKVSKSLSEKADKLYHSLLSYLTINQRHKAYKELENRDIRLDLLEAGMGQFSYPTAKTLFDTYTRSLIDTSSLPSSYVRIKNTLTDSITYEMRTSQPDTMYRPPKGVSYIIGVALPLFKPEDSGFNVIRNMYNGIVYAAEEYNRIHTDKKVFLKFSNTRSDSADIPSSIHRLVWRNPLDAVIGPLFSETALKVTELIEQYELPMLAPLANSDSLNIDNPYVFQANPTFSVRGRRMARHAVHKMGMDTIAVLAGKNTLGYESAFTFRETAERLGAKVNYFFVENYEKKAYDLTDYTKYLTADKEMRDSLNIPQIDGIYAPFTGEAAHTLIDLLLTDLEASKTYIPLLGSAEWGSYEMEEKRLKKFDIYYTEAYRMDKNSQPYTRFSKNYKKRFGTSPNKFAAIGYDVATFLFKSLEKAGNPVLLKDALKKQERFNGISGSIYFDGYHVNQHVEIFEKASENK